MNLLAIDPGNTDSGWVVIDAVTYQPVRFGKSDNDELLDLLTGGELHYDRAVIEMIASYGMAVGASIFETCVWIGRYAQTLAHQGTEITLTYRHEVKLHHCHSSRAKDANITQALVDRFAAGQPNHGKGTKANPGFFHGFRADMWAAYALAVQHADTHASAAAPR